MGGLNCLKSGHKNVSISALYCNLKKVGIRLMPGSASKIFIQSSRVFVAIFVDNFDLRASASSPNCGSSSEKISM